MGNFKLSKEKTNSYIDKLTNKIFSILPIYEEDGLSDSLMSRLDNIIMTFDGFSSLINCSDELTIDVMSLLLKIKKAKSHSEVRTCVLRVCSKLSSLKVG